MYKSDTLLKIGFTNGVVTHTAEDTFNSIMNNYKLLFLANNLNVYKKEDYIKKGNESYLLLISKINHINEGLRKLNKNLCKFSYFKNFQIELIKAKKIRKRFLTFYDFDISENEELRESRRKYNQEMLAQFLENIFKPVTDYLQYFLSTQESETNKFGVTTKSKYSAELFEVVDLFAMGYKRTSLLALGRLLEEIVNNYFNTLVKKMKIRFSTSELSNPKFNYKSFEYSSKLDRLKSKKKLSERDYLILQKLKLDRNIGAHPYDKKTVLYSEEECEQTIKLGIILLFR